MFAVNPNLKPLTVLRNLIRISEQEGSKIQAFMLPTTKQIRNLKGNNTRVREVRIIFKFRKIAQNKVKTGLVISKWPYGHERSLVAM